MPKSSPGPAASPEYRISSLGAGLQVLQAISRQPGVTPAQLAKTLGMTRSRVFRILHTLEELEFVVTDQHHRLRLGLAAAILADSAREQNALLQATEPVLDDLVETTQENVHLVVRRGLHSLVVDVRTSPLPIRMFAQTGRIGPLHAGGASKVLLAYAPEPVIEAVLDSTLEKFTARTVTDRETLLAILEDIRAAGRHFADSDLDEGVFSLAAPIFNQRAEVIAALSVAGPTMRLTQERLERFGELLEQASHRVSLRLGASGSEPL